MMGGGLVHGRGSSPKAASKAGSVWRFGVDLDWKPEGTVRPLLLGGMVCLVIMGRGVEVQC